MQDAFPKTDFPDEIVRLKYPLPHFAKALFGKAPVRIVAMGSSSTAGRADVVPYPHRLEMYLRAHYEADQFPNLEIDVLNRGRGGEEAGDELKRFERDIFTEKPSLVIWQVGTNAVFHGGNIDQAVDQAVADIATGLQQLSGKPMDVVLIDPQYTPAMLFDGKAEASERIVSLISTAADQGGQPVPALGVDAALACSQQRRFRSVVRSDRQRRQAPSKRLEHASCGEGPVRRHHESAPGPRVASRVASSLNR